ncbi:MAG: hypothetical protein AAGD32_06595 [Planctomycetota bacterium]
MKNANVPGVGRASGSVADRVRGLAVYVVPLVLFVGLWVLAGLYKVATADPTGQPIPAVTPSLLDQMTFVETEPTPSREVGFG